MWFKAEYLIHDLWTGEADQWAWSFQATYPLRVTIRPPTSQEKGVGHSKWSSFCCVECSTDPPARVQTTFEQLDRLEIPPGSTFSDSLVEAGRVKERYALFISQLPDPARTFARTLEGELWDYALRTVRVLRWRRGLRGEHNALSNRMGVAWSLDGSRWATVCGDTGASAMAMWPLKVSGPQADEIQSLVASGRSEPTGHILFREAWEQRFSNQRSSLVLGVAAAEIGFKELVAELIPHAGWLVDHVPSPPLALMLEEYLPQLPVRCNFEGRIPPVKNALIKEIKKGVLLRNKTAHVGDPAPRGNSLEGILVAVERLLWLFDYYAGHAWALENVPGSISDIVDV